MEGDSFDGAGEAFKGCVSFLWLFHELPVLSSQWAANRDAA
jgi:hypothetical protein